MSLISLSWGKLRDWSVLGNVSLLKRGAVEKSDSGYFGTPPVPALATLRGAKISCNFTGRFPTREHVHVLGGIAHPKESSKS